MLDKHYSEAVQRALLAIQDLHHAIIADRLLGAMTIRADLGELHKQMYRATDAFTAIHGVEFNEKA